MHGCIHRLDDDRDNPSSRVPFFFRSSMCTLRCSQNCSSSVAKYASTTLLVSSVDIVTREITDTERLLNGQREVSSWFVWAWRGRGVGNIMGESFSVDCVISYANGFYSRQESLMEI